MKREVIFKRVLDGINNCVNDEGVRLQNMFTPFQIQDFANTITAFFPESIEQRLNLLEVEVFDFLPDKRNSLLHSFKSFLGTLYKQVGEMMQEEEVTYNESRILSLYMTFFLSGRLLVEEAGKDPDMLFHNMITYFEKFKLNKEELREEVKGRAIPEHEDPTRAIPINEEEVILVLDAIGISYLTSTTKANDYLKQLITPNNNG